MYAYIVIIGIALALTSCTINWETNRELNEEIFYEYIGMPVAQPVPGQPYEVPPLPEGPGMLYPNPLLLVRQYSLTSAPKAIPEAY